MLTRRVKKTARHRRGPASPAPATASGESSRHAPARRARIFLVDDHALVRRGLADCIGDEPDLTVCGQAGSGAEALEKIPQAKPDLVIVDISLPDCDGLDLIQKIKLHIPQAQVLVLSLHRETLYAERALKAGARGYIMKSAPTEECIAAMRRVLRGEAAVGQGVMGRVLMGLSEPSGGRMPMDSLTKRELQVLRLLGESRLLGEIAAELGISTKTVEVHRDSIRHKLGLRNATEVRQHATLFFHDEASGQLPETMPPRP